MSKFKAKDFEQKVSLPCAHSGCMQPAIIRKKMPTGLADFCRAHYDFHIQQEADKFNRDNGLTTREKQMAYIREKMGKSTLFKRSGEEGWDIS